MTGEKLEVNGNMKDVGHSVDGRIRVIKKGAKSLVLLYIMTLPSLFMEAKTSYWQSITSAP